MHCPALLGSSSSPRQVAPQQRPAPHAGQKSLSRSRLRFDEIAVKFAQNSRVLTAHVTQDTRRSVRNCRDEHRPLARRPDPEPRGAAAGAAGVGGGAAAAAGPGSRGAAADRGAGPEDAPYVLYPCNPCGAPAPSLTSCHCAFSFRSIISYCHPPFTNT